MKQGYSELKVGIFITTNIYLRRIGLVFRIIEPSTGMTLNPVSGNVLGSTTLGLA